MRLMDLSKWTRKRKPRKLVDLSVDEVSAVDRPANKSPWFIVKSEYKPAKVDEEIVRKLENAVITITTDWSLKGTKIKINEQEVPSGLMDVYFNAGTWKEENGKDKDSVSFSYSIRETAEDGAEISRRYEYRNKKEEKETEKTVMNAELEKCVKALFGEVPEEFAAGLSNEEQAELAKSLKVIETYARDLPSDLREAIGACVLYKATNPYDTLANILRDAASKIEGLKEEEDDEEEADKDEKDEDEEEEDEEEEEEEDKDEDKEEDEEEEAEDEKDDEEEEDSDDEEEDDEDESSDEEDEEEAEVELDEETIDAIADEAASEAIEDVIG